MRASPALVDLAPYLPEETGRLEVESMDITIPADVAAELRRRGFLLTSETEMTLAQLLDRLLEGAP